MEDIRRFHTVICSVVVLTGEPPRLVRHSLCHQKGGPGPRPTTPLMQCDAVAGCVTDATILRRGNTAPEPPKRCRQLEARRRPKVRDTIIGKDAALRPAKLQLWAISAPRPSRVDELAHQASCLRPKLLWVV
eukprot:7391672-Prymnesium_polylepis.2